jgi:threonine aldolase
MVEGVWRGFASDNYAGIHPDILDAMSAVNPGHQVAYGDDVYTQQLTSVIKKQFGEQAESFPVFNGTGANVITLQAMCKPWEAVVCATSAHINVDEGGAPEKVAGLKLMQVETPDGKLTPELVDKQAWGFGNEHRAQPKVVSITNSTEYGTVYSVAEIKALADHAHSLGMYLHLDGARISNAAASLGSSLRAFTTDAGVDAVSLGGTKNGAMGAEAAVILNPDLVPAMKYVRKSGMQLASKMRFISIQLVAMFEGDLWLKNAQHSNAMAQALFQGIKDIPSVEVTQPQANALFPILPANSIEPLQEVAKFYVWDHTINQVRWMCSWDTTQVDVDTFVTAVKAELAN